MEGIEVKCGEFLHNLNNVEFLCLEPGCQYKRRLCRLCVLEAHRQHRTCIIDPYSMPFSRFGIYQNHPKREELKLFFRKKVKAIEDEWVMLFQAVQRSEQEFYTKVMLPLYGIEKLFESRAAFDACQQATKQTVPQRLENFVKIFEYLQTADLKNIAKLKFEAGLVSDETAKAINSAQREITSKFTFMMNKIVKGYNNGMREVRQRSKIDHTLRSHAPPKMKKDPFLRALSIHNREGRN